MSPLPESQAKSPVAPPAGPRPGEVVGASGVGSAHAPPAAGGRPSVGVSERRDGLDDEECFSFGWYGDFDSVLDVPLLSSSAHFLCMVTELVGVVCLAAGEVRVSEGVRARVSESARW